MKVFTADEVAAALRVSRKTVFHLIQRGQLNALPGIRHKRITEAALHDYLGVKGAALAAPPARPAATEPFKDKALVNPTAKAVASPLACASQRKIV
ncbi:MAG TPA: helix-turn-helix domain-containing protein [Verrucomicrobiae bacterium]|nr:helix-turn-helix domain-containing protein [Verrucomicrobiae bacterium]